MSGQTTGFSDYHPSWESNKFNKEEYKRLLKELADKDPNSSYMTDSHMLRVVGPVMTLWQKVKGWLGFENQIDPIKVNYDLLKLLRYGENHHYFNDNEISQILQRLSTTLAKDRQYASIAVVINGTLLTNHAEPSKAEALNKLVTCYYQEHLTQLHESFWAEIFHRYITPVAYDTAMVNFNFGRIHASEGHLSEGLVYLQKALEVAPKNVEWQILFADTALRYIPELCEGNEFKEPDLNQAKLLCDHILSSLHPVRITDQDPESINAIDEKLAQAYAFKCAIFLKLGQTDEAIKTLAAGKEALGNNDDLLATYESLISKHPSTAPSATQLGEFYLKLDKYSASNTSMDFLFKALQSLDSAKKTDETQLLLFAGHLAIAQKYYRTSQLLDAKKHAVKALEYYKQLQKSSLKLPFMQIELITFVFQMLANEFKRNKDYKNAIEMVKNVKHILSDDQEAQAKYCFEETKLRLLEGDNDLALDQFTDAMKLNKEGDWINKLIEEFPSSSNVLQLISKYFHAQNNRVQAIAYAKQALALSPNDSTALLYLYDLTEEIGNVEDLEKILTQRPKDWRILLRLGNIYLDKNRNLARNYLTRAQKINGTDPGVLASLGKLSMMEGNYQNAIGYFQNAGAKNFYPEIAECYQRLAEAALTSGQYLQMLEHYTKVFEADPNQKEAVIRKLFEISDTLVDKQKTHALTLYRQLLKYLNLNLVDRKKSAHILRLLAEDEMSRRSYDQAISYLLQSNEYEQQNIRTLNDLASCYTATGKTKEAQSIYDILISLGKVENEDIYVKKAGIHLEKGEFLQALELYRKAAEVSTTRQTYRPEILNCLLLSAEKSASTRNYQHALSAYKEAFEICGPNERNHVAETILHLADNLLKDGNRPLALEAYSIVIPYVEETGAKLASLSNAYILLAETAKDNSNLPQAVIYYQKAAAQNPQNADVHASLGNLYYMTGLLEQALSSYQKAYSISPRTQEYANKLVAIQSELGNLYLSRGLHDPQQILDSTLNLIQRTLTGPEGKNVKYALSDKWSWVGMDSSDNIEFASLGKAAKTPAQIEKAGLRACELLSKAYDGKGHHMKPEQMPKEIENEIQALRKKIADMRHYYVRLQEETNALVEQSYTLGYSSAFDKWKPLPPLKDLSQAKEIEAQANNVLKIIEQATQKNVSGISPVLRTQITTLKQLLLPTGWLSLAASLYRKTLEISPPSLRDIGPQLIDAYTQMGDFHNAALWYETLKQQYPLIAARIQLDPKIYASLALDPTTGSKLTKEQIYNGLVQSGEQYEKGAQHSDALHCYVNALGSAPNPQAVKAIVNKLLQFGSVLHNNGHSDLGSVAYEASLPHLEALSLSKNQKLEIFWRLGSYYSKIDNFEKALGYFEKARGIEPFNGNLLAEFGHLYRRQHDFGNALVYFQRASNCDPTNPILSENLHQAHIDVGNACYSQGLAENLRENVVVFLDEILQSSHSKKIQNALGAWKGSWSADNVALRELARKDSNVQKVLEDAAKAIELIKKAYDGGRNHMKPEEMPKSIQRQISSLQQSIDNITKLNIPLEGSITTSSNSFHTFNRAIEQYEKASQALPTSYNDFYNKWIDTLVHQQKYAEAIDKFKTMQAQFPNMLIIIEPQSFISYTEDLMLKGKSSEALEMIATAITLFPQVDSLKEQQSHLYFLIGKSFAQKGNDQEALTNLNKALKCGVIAEPACYIAIGHIYKRLFHTVTAAEPFKLANLAVINFKRAAALDKYDAVCQFECGKAMLDWFPETLNEAFDKELKNKHDSSIIDPVPYLRSAVELDKNNILYAYTFQRALKQLLIVTDDKTGILALPYKYTQKEIDAAEKHLIFIGGDPKDSWDEVYKKAGIKK